VARTSGEGIVVVVVVVVEEEEEEEEEEEAEAAGGTASLARPRRCRPRWRRLRGGTGAGG